MYSFKRICFANLLSALSVDAVKAIYPDIMGKSAGFCLNIDTVDLSYLPCAEVVTVAN